jgi:hypothetical protein
MGVRSVGATVARDKTQIGILACPTFTLLDFWRKPAERAGSNWPNNRLKSELRISFVTHTVPHKSQIQPGQFRCLGCGLWCPCHARRRTFTPHRKTHRKPCPKKCLRKIRPCHRIVAPPILRRKRAPGIRVARRLVPLAVSAAVGCHAGIPILRHAGHSGSLESGFRGSGHSPR